jgi:UDP-glucose 4-epimerase
VQAVEQFSQIFERAGSPETRYVVINLGTGHGVTVRELVTAFEKVYGREVNKVERPPRPGDVAGAYANADTAKTLLGWEARLPIEQGIADALRWGEVREGILHFTDLV